MTDSPLIDVMSISPVLKAYYLGRHKESQAYVDTPIMDILKTALAGIALTILVGHVIAPWKEPKPCEYHAYVSANGMERHVYETMCDVEE